MGKDSRKNVQENLKLAMKRVGYHCTKNEVFHWGFLHLLCSVCFISFTIFVLKTTSMYFDQTLTLSAVFFKYLPNILQHSSLNDCFHEDSESKTANVFLLIFAGFYCSYGDTSVNAL